MSAQRLRDAAAKVRELARLSVEADGEGAWAPWLVGGADDCIGGAWGVSMGPGRYIVSAHSNEETAEHIALWSPAVALAVANLLEISAPTWEKCEELAARMPFEPPTQGFLVTALALADGILGAES